MVYAEIERNPKIIERWDPLGVRGWLTPQNKHFLNMLWMGVDGGLQWRIFFWGGGHAPVASPTAPLVCCMIWTIKIVPRMYLKSPIWDPKSKQFSGEGLAKCLGRADDPTPRRLRRLVLGRPVCKSYIRHCDCVSSGRRWLQHDDLSDLPPDWCPRAAAVALQVPRHDRPRASVLRRTLAQLCQHRLLRHLQLPIRHRAQAAQLPPGPQYPIIILLYYKIVHVVQNNEKNTRDNQK